MKNIKELLNSFTLQNEQREFDKPFLYDNYICATNGFTAIQIPKEMVTKDIEYRESVKFNFGQLIEETNSDFKMTFDALFNMVVEIPQIPEIITTECIRCEGEGEYTCGECGQDVECETCHGSGNTYEKVTGFTIPDPKHLITLDGAYFSAKIFLQLYEVAKFFKAEEIIKLYGDEMTVNAFKIKDVIVYIMPIRKPE